MRDFELLLIDDGGKDGCPEIIDEYAAKDERVKACHKVNSGYGATCNFGLQKACGKYISIIEPDDFLEPEMFSDLYEIALKSDADIVKSSYYINFETKDYTNQVLENFAGKFKVSDAAFTIHDCPEFLSNHPSIWSAIYKKDFLDKHQIKFVEVPGAGWADNPFQVQTMCLADKIVYTPKAYYHWRVETLNDEDALKDYTIPIKRAEEINNWVNLQDFAGENILKPLYQREVSNMFLVLSKNELNTAKDRIRLSRDFIRTLNPDILKLLSRKDQKRVKLLKEHPYICYVNIHLKKFMRSVFKLKWNKEQKFFILFGKMYNFSK